MSSDQMKKMLMLVESCSCENTTEDQQVDEINVGKWGKAAVAAGALAAGGMGLQHTTKATPTPDEVTTHAMQIMNNSENQQAFQKAHDLSMSSNPQEAERGALIMQSLFGKAYRQAGDELSRSADTMVNRAKDAVSGQHQVVPGSERGNFKESDSNESQDFDAFLESVRGMASGQSDELEEDYTAKNYKGPATWGGPHKPEKGESEPKKKSPPPKSAVVDKDPEHKEPVIAPKFLESQSTEDAEFQEFMESLNRIVRK